MVSELAFGPTGKQPTACVNVQEKKPNHSFLWQNVAGWTTIIPTADEENKKKMCGFLSLMNHHDWPIADGYPFPCHQLEYRTAHHFVGDPNQLPPIGYAKIFADLIDWLPEENKWELKENLRQRENKLKAEEQAFSIWLLYLFKAKLLTKTWRNWY